MTFLLQALGASAVLGLNVAIWTWAVGVVREFRRERYDAHIAVDLGRALERNRKLTDLNKKLVAELAGFDQLAKQLEAQIAASRPV